MLRGAGGDAASFRSTCSFRQNRHAGESDTEKHNRPRLRYFGSNGAAISYISSFGLMPIPPDAVTEAV